MFKIMMLPDAENFLNVVSNSRGQVLLHLPDDSRCDLKRDNTARQLLRAMRPREEGLLRTGFPVLSFFSPRPAVDKRGPK